MVVNPSFIPKSVDVVIGEDEVYKNFFRVEDGSAKSDATPMEADYDGDRDPDGASGNNKKAGGDMKGTDGSGKGKGTQPGTGADGKMSTAHSETTPGKFKAAVFPIVFARRSASKGSSSPR